MTRFLSALVLVGVVAPAVVAQQWGSVKGQIVFGDKTTPKPRVIAAAPPACCPKGPLTDEDLLVDPDTLGVANVLAYLAPAAGAKALDVHPNLQAIPKDPLVIDQPRCMFVPRIAVVREGQVLTFNNSAPLPHNVNFSGKLPNPEFNVLLGPKQSRDETKLRATRRPVNVTCNLHDWMKGFVMVLKHPYAVVTGRDGTFEIKDAPAGECRLYLWHEKLGWFNTGGDKGEGQPITIPAGGTLDLGKVTMPPPEKP